MNASSDQQRREYEEKNLAHYSVMIQAWVDSKMEHDRTIVTVSAAGIGLLVTILTTVGVTHQWELLLYAGSFAGLGSAIFVSLRIFQRNSAHIERAIRESSNHDPILARHDLAQNGTFLAGVLLFVVIGIVSAFNKLAGGLRVSDNPKNSSSTHAVVGDSLNGINRLGASDFGKSLNGIGALAPAAPAQQPTSATTPSPISAGSNQAAVTPSSASGSK